ncbi:predicted protein [Postia placenta Mad-698-R]|nr:predicted protein [Postia placenta Mad-698-R]
MVQPFPNELWLDIFKGLAEEGELDVLARCSMVCRGFRPMARRWLRHAMAFTNVGEVERIKVDVSGGGNSKDERRPLPHLATFVSRLAGRWTSVDELKIYNAAWQARDLDLDGQITQDGVSSITELNLYDVTLPSILTLGQLVCALPLLTWLDLNNVQFNQQPRDAGTISRFHLLPHTQLRTITLDHGSNDAELRPSFVELVDLMAAVSNRRCPFAPLNLAQASPWSAVRRLVLANVTFPSVTTFARLLCALPALESLEFRRSCAFVRHGFDLRSVPVNPGLPLQLADVELAYDFSLHSDPCSVADLADFFIATGLSENLRRIKACLSPLLRVANEVDVALNRLVKHSVQSLHHLSLNSYSPYDISNDAYEWIRADHSAGASPITFSLTNPQSISIAPYFDVSENTCLEYLDLKIQITRADMSHLCAPVVEILSRVTSTHISRIQVYFHRYVCQPGPEIDVDLEALMDELPQLDALLSGPIFHSLTNVFVYVSTLKRPDLQYEDAARELRLCLPRLDARGLLGIGFNAILYAARIGMHWDEDMGELRCHRIKEAAAQDAVPTNGGTSADGDRHTNNATTGASPHEAAAYADAQRPSSSNLMDAQVPAASACDDEPVSQNATAVPGTSVDISAPDDDVDLLRVRKVNFSAMYYAHDVPSYTERERDIDPLCECSCGLRHRFPLILHLANCKRLLYALFEKLTLNGMPSVASPACPRNMRTWSGDEAGEITHHEREPGASSEDEWHGSEQQAMRGKRYFATEGFLSALHNMVLPFPNEIWLHIFHDLAKEGEYDAERARKLGRASSRGPEAPIVVYNDRARCTYATRLSLTGIASPVDKRAPAPSHPCSNRGSRPMAQDCLLRVMRFKNTEDVERIKVDASGGEMRRWRGPRHVFIGGGNWNDGRQPIPYLATFASRFGGRWPSIVSLTISKAVWRAVDLDADTVFRDLARFPSITFLSLSDVMLPTILTLGRLVCALPHLKWLRLSDVQFIQRPFEAFTISQFCLLPCTQLETLFLSRLDNASVPAPFFVELVEFIASVSNRKCLTPLSHPTQACPWSAVRTLHFFHAGFPSVTTFARFLCALPALETLVFAGGFTFLKHGFDLRNIPAHLELPPQLVTADLSGYSALSPKQLQAIKISPSLFLRVAAESDVSLNKLVRHSGQSLYHFSLGLSQFRISPHLDGETLSPQSDLSPVPYFDLSENTYLDHLEFIINYSHEIGPYLWTRAFDVISQVTSTHISRLSVQSRPNHCREASFDFGKLIEKLPQLDDILSRPVFDNLAHVNVHVRTLYRSKARDEKWANNLRVCLAKLDEHGILGISVNSIRIGLHWDHRTKYWKRYGVERDAAQNDIKNSEVARVSDESCTNDADSRTIPCNDPGTVLAALQGVSASSADAQTSSSPLSPNARVAAELDHDDGIAQQGGATTCSDTYLNISAPEEQATDAESSMSAGLS